MIYKDTQAIVFDFDGVLVESVAVKGEAFVELYKDYGQEVQRDVLDYHLRNGGVSRQEKIRYLHANLLGKTLNKEEVDHLSKQFSKLVRDRVINSDWVPGAEDFLKKYNKKIPLFVASATPQLELEHILEAKDMHRYFQGVYGSPIKKEKHLKFIADANDFVAEKIIMIGDTIHDFNAAMAAGTIFIGRLSPDAPETFPPGTTVIPNLLDLAPMVGLSRYD